MGLPKGNFGVNFGRILSMSTFATMGMRSFLFLLAISLANWGATNDALNATKPPAQAEVKAPAPPPTVGAEGAGLADAREILANAVRGLASTNAAAAKVEGGNAGASAGPAAEISFVSRDILDDTIKLHPGDTVRYRVAEDKEPTLRMGITDGGEIEIPYLGYIKAQGKTCKELAAEVKQLLEKDYYYNATVNIAVETVVRKSLGRVWVYGAVASPGAQEIPQDEPWTVSKAVLRAGPTEFANRAKVKLKKGGALSGGASPPIDKGRKDEFIIVDVDEIFKKGRSEKDVAVEPGDAIIVDSLMFNLGR